MADWLARIGELPALLLMASLGVVMVFDTIPLVGMLVPADVALIAIVDARGPASGGVVVITSVVVGCLGGWSLTFLAGRYFGARIRRGRIGAWIGESRWAMAEQAVSRGGARMVVAAPFLPVLNTLVPLAAGGLRMSYRRFVACAALGSALWAGLYVVLGMVAARLGDLLPGESSATIGTLAIGMAFGWLGLLASRRQLRGGGAAPRGRTSAGPRVVAVAGDVARRQRSTTRPALSSRRRLVSTASSMRRSWVTSSSVPGVRRERRLQLLDRGQVEVVGRLVEDQQVDAARLEQRERRPGALAGREGGGGAQHVGGPQPELREQRPHVGRRPASRHGRAEGVQQRLRRRGTARAPGRPRRRPRPGPSERVPGVQRQPAEQRAEQGGLAGAVGAGDARPGRPSRSAGRPGRG